MRLHGCVGIVYDPYGIRMEILDKIVSMTPTIYSAKSPYGYMVEGSLSSQTDSSIMLS